jgi:hypothetical protein
LTVSDEFNCFDTPAHRAAQAACHHFIRCAVDADTRRATSADLGNARATGSNLIPVYMAMFTGPCTSPPHRADLADPTPGDTIAADPTPGSVWPDDPAMLADIIPHAGTLGEDDDEQVRVRAFVNLYYAVGFDSYRPLPAAPTIIDEQHLTPGFLVTDGGFRAGALPPHEG